MANLLWSMESVAHAKSHYGRACHCEVSTLLSMFCKPFLTIILMTGCTGILGDTLDLTQDCRWFPSGFGLLIRDPNPQRATLAHIGVCLVNLMFLNCYHKLSTGVCNLVKWRCTVCARNLSLLSLLR